MVFSSSQKITEIEDADDSFFVPISFDEYFKKQFPNIVSTDDHRRVSGDGFSFEYFVSSDLEGHTILSLDAESALFEIVHAAKQNGWQLFDTGNGQMIDLDSPEENGYIGFRSYLDTVILSRNQR